MNSNYEYIISSLPAISLDWKYGDGASFEGYIDWIKTQLSASDCRKVDELLDGFKDENLVESFYEKALGSSCRFIKEYFTFDLNVRNGKAKFLNKAFGRPAEQDTIRIATSEFAEAAALDEALSASDLLSRERNMDQLMWNKIGEITIFDYFNLDAVLAFIAKLKIINRWLSLDEEAGKQMFRQLVDEVRATFTGVNYVAPTDK